MNAFLPVSLALLGSVLGGSAQATDYYVATTGNDTSGTGTSALPWRTIQHCADTITTGNRCLIKTGIYAETVTPKSGGTYTFMPDTGATVTITGTADYPGGSNWSTTGPVYLSSITPLPTPSDTLSGPYYTPPANTQILANQLFCDGQMMNEARWPNLASGDSLHPTGDPLRPALSSVGSAPAYACIDTTHTCGANMCWDPNRKDPVTGLSSPGCSDSASAPFARFTIGDSALTQAANYWTTGGDSVTPSAPAGTIQMWAGPQWWINTGSVYSSAVGQVVYNATSVNSLDIPHVDPGGSKYFLSGKRNAVDSPGEWYYYGGYLSFSTPDGANPATHSVKYKVRNYAFDLSGKSNITIKGLNLFAATILTNSSSHDNVIDGINARYVSHSNRAGAHTRNTGILLHGYNNTLKNSVVAYSAGSGVSVQGRHNTVYNNVIHDIDYLGEYNAPIFVLGSDHVITHNSVFNSGREGIYGNGWDNYGNFINNEIGYNNVFNTMMLSKDGGGFYSSNMDANGPGGWDGVNRPEFPANPNYPNWTGPSTRVHHNWFHDLLASEVVNVYYSGAGIYLDNGSNDFLVENNVVWNNKGDGIRLNMVQTGSTGNKIYDNTVGLGQTGGSAMDAFFDPITGALSNSNDSSTRYRNNIFRSPHRLKVSATTPPYFSNDWNVYNQWGSAYGDAQVYPGGTYNALTPTNLESVTSPGLLDEANYDYHLASGTVIAVDTGRTIADYPLGYFGSNPDIGAYEYGLTGQGWYYSDGSNTWSSPGIRRPISANIEAEHYDGSKLYTTPSASGTTNLLPDALLYRNGPYSTLTGLSGEGLDNLNAGDWVRYNNVDFGSGHTGTGTFLVHLAVPSNYAGKKIQVYLDNLLGSPIATLTISQTTASSDVWTVYADESGSATATNGLHDVILKINAATTGTPNLNTRAGKLDYFKFSYTP